MRALVFDSFGGPEVLQNRDIVKPALVAGTALVRMKAIGLNFADVYRRRGGYTIDGQPPYIAGYEGAGVVEEFMPTAQGETFGLTEGTRVGFADVPRANAEFVLAPLEKLIPLPERISFEQAAASLLQGLTAQYLLHDSRAVQKSETILVHACAGGVGSLLLQMGKRVGAMVLGLTSSEAKAQWARQLGADHVFVESNSAAWVQKTLTVTNDLGVDVVYDSTGSTLNESLAACRVGGQVVFYGFAGGNPPPLDVRRLMDSSKSVTGGDLWNVLRSHTDRVTRARRLFDSIAQGIQVHVAARFSLEDGAQAHALLESRQSMGKVLMLV
jgi:NADPH:quinone reductase